MVWLSGEAQANLGVFASTNLAEIVPVGGITCPHASCPITVRIVGTFTNFYVGHAVIDCCSLAGRQPVLRVCMPIPQPVAGQARHRVVQVRDPVFITRLLRDVSRELLVADARRSVCVDVAGEAVLAQPRAGHGGHGCAQAMASGDDAEVWVACAGRFHEIRYGWVHVIEGGCEASVDLTAIAQVSVGGDSFQAADKFSSRSAQCGHRSLNSLVGERSPVVRSLEGDNNGFLYRVHSNVTTGARTIIGAAESVSRSR